MKKILVAISLLLFAGVNGYAQNKKTMNKQIAQQAFDAWGIAEGTGNYDTFKALVSTDFSTYSHPLYGNFTGATAKEKMMELMTGREKNSNQLKFSNVVITNNGSQYAFAFDSEGKVAGGYPYKGFNIIVLTIDKQKVTGFREYFGFVDPAWFKQ
jgi:ketosteroid isomerase-like protein